jgi:hypothetical protein
VGYWGEGAGSAMLQEKTRKALVDAYLEAFPNTHKVMLLTDEKTNKYGREKGNVGWRVDCIGDAGFGARAQKGWTHMWDYYPQGIIDFGMADAWKTAPVTLEICWTLLGWKDKQGYGIDEVRYIFDQSLKWHISSFNAKSSPVPKDWWPQVNRWLKKMGYRFALRKFTYPAAVSPGGQLAFTSWWENKGVAPCYRRFRLALRLRSDRQSVILPTGADPRTWLPGDNLYDGSVTVPAAAPEGPYQLQLGILDERTDQPRVKLAVAGRQPDGWYTMGKIELKR